MHLPYRFGDRAGSGSASFGVDLRNDVKTSILVVLNRWHELTRHGTTLVTLIVGNFSVNLDGVDDGFGNLVTLSEHSDYHRTSPRDD